MLSGTLGDPDLAEVGNGLRRALQFARLQHQLCTALEDWQIHEVKMTEEDADVEFWSFELAMRSKESLPILELHRMLPSIKPRAKILLSGELRTLKPE